MMTNKPCTHPCRNAETCDVCRVRTMPETLQLDGTLYVRMSSCEEIRSRALEAEANVRELEQQLELIASFAGKTLIGPYDMGSEEMRAYTTGANLAFEECASLAALHVTDKAVKNG